MQFANVDGRRELPTPKLKGTCPLCGDAVLAKCGTKKVWHWAHAGRLHCDPWWENETEWHRAWKGCFPANQREIVRFDAKGEKHVADVLTAGGVVLEFQNSAMSATEMAARESFYGEMYWIVNAQQFASRFEILWPLPSPDSAIGKDAVFSVGASPCFWRRSEQPNFKPHDLVRIHSMTEIGEEVAREYEGHHVFRWKNARDVWFGAGAPVLLDFGDQTLWRLAVFSADHGPSCVRWMYKEEFVSQQGGDPALLAVPAGQDPIVTDPFRVGKPWG
jgi:competence protein CoiA